MADGITNVPIRTPMFDAAGNLTRTWIAFFQSALGGGTGGGGVGPAGPAGPPGPAGSTGSGTREGSASLSAASGSGFGGTTLEIQIDLAGGKHQWVTLTAAMETPGSGGAPPTTHTSFPRPIRTGDTIAEGDTFILHVDQDVAGYHPLPLFAAGMTGGWAADCQIEIAPDPGTSTVFQFGFIGGLWRMIADPRRNVATS